jgi:predicted kinase
VIRGDEIRKRLSGISSLDRLGPEGHSSEMSERVYTTVAERARLTIRSGHGAIVDSVHARLGERQAIEQVAADVAVPFVCLWLEAPEDTLITRAERRARCRRDCEPPTLTGWHRTPTTGSQNA